MEHLKLIPIPNNQHYYAASDGNIYSTKKGPYHKLTGGDNGKGYRVVYIFKKTYKVHRLIAMTFLSNIEGKKCVNHKNGEKYDNRVENLEWATSQENSAHAFANGLCINPKGESHYNAILTDEKVKGMRMLHSNGVNCADIGRAYGVSNRAALDVVNRKSWKHVT